MSFKELNSRVWHANFDLKEEAKYKLEDLTKSANLVLSQMNKIFRDFKTGEPDHINEKTMINIQKLYEKAIQYNQDFETLQLYSYILDEEGLQNDEDSH